MVRTSGFGVDHHNLHQSREVLMVHRNAPLTETGRLRLARCVVDDGWPLRRAAERFQVSLTTAERWAGRYRQVGAAGMADRSSPAPASPAARPADRTADRGAAGTPAGPGPDRLPAGPGPLHRARGPAPLRRPRLAHLDRATGVPVRRYERDRPGELVHVDIKKLGNIPDGGGWRIQGAAPGQPQQAGHHHRPGKDTTGRSWATATCTPPWMTTPAWPTPRSCPTRPRKPPPRSWPARTPGTPPPGSPSSA